MTITQQLNHIQENSYDDDVQLTDIPKGYFPAVVSNRLPQGASTREIQVDLLPLEQSPGGTMPTNSGLYVKGAEETAVKVCAMQDGKLITENTQSY